MKNLIITIGIVLLLIMLLVFQDTINKKSHKAFSKNQLARMQEMQEERKRMEEEERQEEEIQDEEPVYEA